MCLCGFFVEGKSKVNWGEKKVVGWMVDKTT